MNICLRSRLLFVCWTVILPCITAHYAAATQPDMPPPDPVTRQELLSEIDVKMNRVQTFLRNEHLAGMLLTRVNNFSWMTAGIADNEIVITSELGAASLLIMADGHKYVLGEEGEVSRHMHEDLAGLDYVPEGYKWYEDQNTAQRGLEIVHQLAHGQTIGTDVPYGDLKMLALEFAPLRYQLTESEVKKYRWVGQEATKAVTTVCRQIYPGLTEKQIEAMASRQLMQRRLRPTVLLIGVDQRVTDFYHHTPTDARLRKYAIVNVCARRWGLVASVARFVHFGPLPADLKRRLNAAATISAEYQASSRPGITAGQMLDKAKGWFAHAGFPEDWEMHHQGGAIGYAEREWLGAPGSKQMILDHEAFAWNPILRGTLSFDTILAYNDHIENLTRTLDWPSIAVEIEGKVYQMPGILIRQRSRE